MPQVQSPRSSFPSPPSTGRNGSFPLPDFDEARTPDLPPSATTTACTIFTSKTFGYSLCYPPSFGIYQSMVRPDASLRFPESPKLLEDVRFFTRPEAPRRTFFTVKVYALAEGFSIEEWVADWVKKWAILKGEVMSVTLGGRRYLRWVDAGRSDPGRGEHFEFVVYASLLTSQTVIKISAPQASFGESEQFLDILSSLKAM